MLKISLRASRLCLDHNEIDLAIVPLECCSQYVTVPSEPGPLMHLATEDTGSQSDVEIDAKTLAGEYLLLRLLHGWKSGQQDLGEHFFSKLDLTGARPMTRLSLKAADLFAEIGRSSLTSDRREDAVVWFERAFAAATANDDHADHETEEMRLTAGIYLGKTPLALPRPIR